MKICTKCKQNKENKDFNKSKITKDRLYSYCKSCASKNMRRWGQINKEKKLNINKEWRKQNPDKVQSSNYRNSVNKKLKSFGITQHEYDLLLKDQNGVCKICSNKNGKRLLAIDHCHKTGKIRGLLCTNCNVGLGLFKDSNALLAKAMEYLNKVVQ